MLAVIPAFQPDQTIESVVMLAGLHNGLRNPLDAKEAIFGKRFIKIAGLFSSGLSVCFDRLKGAGYTTFRDFIEHHGNVALIKPFVPAETYDRALQKLESDNHSGTLSMLSIGSIRPICSSFKYCAECARRELQTLGYAYAHRTHQIIGIDVCPEHMVTLGMSAGTFNVVAASQGLLISSFKADDLVSVGAAQLGSPDSSSTNSTERNFGAWVRAAFAGDLPASEERHRLDTVRARLSAIPRQPGESNSGASRLQRMVRQAYGQEYLERLGFAMKPGPTEHWPALYFMGRVYVRNTFASLLVLNVLFDSPAAYVIALELQRDKPDMAASPNFKSRGSMRLVWSIGLVKDFLRISSLVTIAKKYHTDYMSIREQLRAHPDLPARRARSLLRIRVRHARHRALEFLEQHPDGSGGAFRKYDNGAFQYLNRHDRDWFDKHFATRRMTKSPATSNKGRPSPVGLTAQLAILVAAQLTTPIFEPAE